MSMLACATGDPVATAPPQAQLQFVDIQGFDRDLARSLSTPLPRVDVAFYDRIVPSALPQRLQPWMAAVEAGGGVVRVVPPKSSITSKSPFLLISVISAAWTASKMGREMSAQAQFRSAHAFDAEIQLRTDDKGDLVVDKVVFLQRTR